MDGMGTLDHLFARPLLGRWLHHVIAYWLFCILVLDVNVELGWILLDAL